jgi:hypothetical protein
MSMIPRSLAAASFAMLIACAAERPAPSAPDAAPEKLASSSAQVKPIEIRPPEYAASAAPRVPEAKPVHRPTTPTAPPAKPESKVASMAPPPAPAKPPATAPLDLKSLEERLKGTNAIGVLTKLSLKNQVDDLIGEFRAYHQGTRPPTLSQLRPAFELLLMKVLSLLQDRDPALAHDVSASRDAIWAVLADPQKLAQFS